MRITYLLILLSNLIVSCKQGVNNAANQNVVVHENNIFNDTRLQEIYDMQDRRDTKGLLPILSDEMPKYREAAALAFASVQDSNALIKLAGVLHDENENVRIASAYALGQSGMREAVSPLLSAYDGESSAKVKGRILEALGKTGGEQALNFVTSLNFSQDDITLLEGQAYSLTRFAMRGQINSKSTQKAVELVEPFMPERIRFVVSQYFPRLRNTDLSSYSKDLVAAFNADGYVYTRMNLIRGMKFVKTHEARQILEKIIKNDYDYRIKVNAIDALSSSDYSEVKELIFIALDDFSQHVAVRASEYFMNQGSSTDAGRYAEKAAIAENWRVQSNLYAAALKYTLEPENISYSIKQLYESTDNVYAKAHLLKALTGSVENYIFLAKELKNSGSLVIRTYALDALADIRRSDKFDLTNKSFLSKGKENLNARFAQIFKDAIKSGDAAQMSIAALLLREPEMEFSSRYENTYFLNQALEKCKLPRDLEAYLELQKTIAFFSGELYQPLQNNDNKTIDWKVVSSISANQKIRLKTSRGDIVLELKVNDAPGTVANFVKLIQSGFYANKVVHRVVPNFVAQGGCPRGDGWGSPEHTIRSEFAPLYYEEGTVGMASAGKDTEGSQWFITHSPTPHLDGRYTIFAQVVSGMEHVHELQIGDKIHEIVIE